jgi:leucyl aminopeptidase
MPLFEGYRRQIQPAIADLSNTGTSKFGGSLTAALFLDHFVDAGIDWMHLDVYAWNLGDRPGRPAGGEAQGLRAIFDWLEKTYG